MTRAHLRPLLPDVRGSHLLFQISQRMARGQVPEAVISIIRMGRLTALSKPDGGVRGIVAGDVVRRLVARTMSEQLSPAVERVTSPYQCAMTTRAGCECVAHALQGLMEIDPQVTVTSIDGLGAYDMTSRGAMLRGLMRVSGAALPFTRMFYGRLSQYLWEMDSGEVHRIPQGEGGEQGDPMMPLLYCLRQHGALEAANTSFTRGVAFSGWHIHCYSHRSGGWSSVRSRPECTQEPLWHPGSCGEDQDLEPPKEPTRSLRRLGEDCTDGHSTSQGVGVPAAHSGTRHQCWALLWAGRLRGPTSGKSGGRAPHLIGAHSQGPRRAECMFVVVALRISTGELPALPSAT